METFLAEYEKQLTLAVQNFPQEYGFGVEKVPYVIAKFRIAISEGTFNKDGRAFKATCKALKIPHTYKAINNFIFGERKEAQ